MLDALPGHWQAALLEIAALRSRAYKGVACIPGGEAVVYQLIDFGAVELVASDPRFCTLSTWGAEMIGVGLYEWDDDSEPVWTSLGLIAAQDSERQGIPTRAERGMVRWLSMDRLDPWTTRIWHTDEPDDAPPEVVKDDFENAIVLFAGNGGAGLTLYRERARLKKISKKKLKKRAAKAAGERRTA